MRTDILDKKEQILVWIAEKRPKSFICKELRCKAETLNKYLEKMGISYSGQPGVHGEDYKTNYKSAQEYISCGSVVKSHILKQKLIRDGIKANECELCGISMWRGVKIPLELHHKDGNHFNNELDNLIILCPNCHSIQEGNSGANVGKYTSEQ
jgi:5-methylcytosine-specific restriction endonuclease McrA